MEIALLYPPMTAEVHACIVAALQTSPQGHFVVNDLETIERQMASGVTLGALDGEELETLAAIFHIYFPTPEESYAPVAGDTCAPERVAHMDIASVLPRYRGQGLMKTLMGEGERLMDDAHPSRDHRYATVHTHNTASLKSLQALGYTVVKHITNSAGDERLLMRKVTSQR